MAFYRCIGDVPPKRHTQHRRPDGGLYAEELMGEEGFSSDSALLYHRGIPSAIVEARPWDLPSQATVPNMPLVPRHLKLHELVDGNEWKRLDGVTGRRLVLGNADRPDLLRGRRRNRRPTTAMRSVTSACTSSRAKRCSRPCSARWTSARATT